MKSKLTTKLLVRGLIFLLAILLAFSACRRSGASGGIDILAPSDDTDEAAAIVVEANQDLMKIKVLYENNEGRREDLKNAMKANDAEKAKKIADDIVYLINDGTASGNDAVEKLQKAQEMHINDDYREYLRLKEESLKRQLKAFDNYREAAHTLRENFDPKNAAQREKVTTEFKTRSENYQKIMEDARDFSNRANELAKDAMRKQQQN